MLLKKPESGGIPSQKNRAARNTTFFLCFLAIIFFGYRLALIYKNSKIMPVVAPIAQNPATADTTPLAIDTSTPNPIDTSTKATLSDATKPLGGLYTPVAPLPHRIGMAMGSQLTGLNDTDLEKEVSGMQAMGVKIVRYDIDWGFVQQNSASQYDWSKYDRIANSLKKHGIVGLGIIINTPPWARTAGCTGGAHCPPNDPNQFATFATALVNRYKSYGMHYWEIWNEENDYDFWATKSDCGAYTTLLKAVYPAIKKADPGAYVITGGLAQVANTNVNIAPLDFLQCVYKDGGKNYFDAVGYHPYTFPALPSANSTNAWAGMSNGNPSVRSIMNANGDSAKQIWITEYGAPTNGPDSKWYLSEDQQSKMVTDTINLYKSYSWAGPLFWYTYRDGGTTTDTNENFFGLVRNDYSQKPAYQTMQGFLSSGLN